MDIQQLKAQYGNIIPDKADIIRQPFWERKTYTSATTTQLSFLDSKITDPALGFQPAAGQIPPPNMFLIRSVGIYVVPGTNFSDTSTTLAAPKWASDVGSLLTSKSYLQMIVGSKEYLKLGPLAVFNPGFGVSGFGAIHFAQASAANQYEHLAYAQAGTPDSRDKWFMDPPLLLQPGQNFSFTVNWSAAQTLIGGNAEVILYLDGHYIRTAQ